MDSYDKVYQIIDRVTQSAGRTGKDLKTWGEVFDRPTVMTLHKLLRNDILRSIDYPVNTGKEANVFKGTSGDGDDVAIKIYRVHTATFRNVLKYIEGDPRFRKVPREHRPLVHAWCRKEYRNLERFREAGVDVPIPFKALDNVIVMEYLQREDGPARTMKDQPPEDPSKAYEKLWDDYRRLLKQARSVHADFSEYNALMVDGTPRIIDVGQSVLDTHPMAGEFMARDLKNFSRYFAKRDVDVDGDALLAEARAIVKANESKELVLEEEF